MFEFTHDTARLLWSGASVLAFGLVCCWRLWPSPKTASQHHKVQVLYASQTGQAEEIARHTQARLIAGGIDAGMSALGAFDLAGLKAAQTLLIMAATTGEGDAPDDARVFEKRLMTQQPDLWDKRFAVLALGDRKYAAFCAFGLRVHAWLEACGGQALTPCLTADDLDAQTLSQWQRLIDELGAAAVPDDNPAQMWTLADRQQLNPQSASPLYRLRLTPPESIACAWQAGDLIEIKTEDGHRRDYSIASLPHEGYIELYVREVTGINGLPGKGSGLLIHKSSVDGQIGLRIKSHDNFHAPSGDGPLLLIGAGSGLAGLRAHILSAKMRKPWLVYGERHPLREAALITEAETWLAHGKLHRLSLAFSQPDDGAGRYVQDVLKLEGARVYEHLIHDGAILVCGGLNMGRAVDKVLRDLMGDAWIEKALASGRYRRDLY